MIKLNAATYFRIFYCLSFLLFAFIDESYSQKISDEQIIKKTYQDWVKTANQKDIDQWSTFLAPGAIFLPPDQPGLKGNKAIREFYSALFQDERFSLSCKQDTVEILTSGDYAWSMGYCEATFSDANGSAAHAKTKWVKLWMHLPDGDWKCKISSWSSVGKK